ncbi:MAG: HEAT repeat domain-containing protein [Gammaproteobacteria bacterium]|nr:HEAT repeat domain-containing protein [Gammaproteobacteria bacterium]
MEFVALSDPSVRLAFWLGASSVTITLILIFRVVMLRLFLLRRERHSSQFTERWQPPLLRCIMGDHVEFPTLHANDEMDLIYLAVHFHETLRGDAKDRINQALQILELGPRLRSILQDGSLDERLAAATALGHMQDHLSWDVLKSLLNDGSSALSVIAARSLVLIDAEAASTLVIPVIISRRDWPTPKLVTMIKESAVLQQEFLQQVARDIQHRQPYLPRMMRLVEAIRPNQPLPFIRDLLNISDDAELISAGLRLTRDPEDLDLIRGRADDRHLAVQVQVASALGRLGTEADVPRLIALLNSREWWVRYRAAQSLINLPFLGRDSITQIIGETNDPFARDMLKQVLAETVTP